MSEKILAIIPALNAERTLPPVIRTTRGHVEDVLVVDDGSRDRTGDAARGEGATVLRHEKNRGKGGALKTGFAYAIEKGYDGVITLDADGQHLPAEIGKILDCWRQTGADLVIGGRAHLFDRMIPRRRIANRFSAWSIAWASGSKVTDSQSGFRFYSAHLLRSVELHTDGFDMESEVIVRAGRAGCRIVTTPVDLGFVDGQSTSHYLPVRDTLKIAWTVFRARFFWS